MKRLVLRRNHLAQEEGVALILAVVIIAIITIAAASAIFYTQGSQSDAYSKKSNQTAYSLAQAALSQATAQLFPYYYDSTGQPIDSTTSLSTMATWAAPSGSQPSGCSTTSPGASCMRWQSELCPGGVCPDGHTSSISGVERAVWHVTGTGAVPNPSGTKPITRTITIDVPLLQKPSIVPAPDIFKAVYSGKPDDGACDLTMGQGVYFNSPLYVVGNLCINQHAGLASPGTLVVGGWLDTGQKGAVGTSAAPVSSMAVGGACDGTHGSMPACTLPYDSSNGYYALPAQNLYSSAPVSNSPKFPDPPSVDWAARQADAEGWSCTGGQSLDNPTFDLGGSPYSCTLPSSGSSLIWDGTTLSVTGNIYLSGNLVTSNNEDILYTGIGSIYVAGTATFGNNSSICVGSTSKHACPSGPNWDTSNNFLLILAKGTVSGKNLNLEGGLYSDTSIDFGSGQTGIDGPMVTPLLLSPGQQASSGFPDIQSVISGAPDTGTFWTLGAPTNGTY